MRPTRAGTYRFIDPKAFAIEDSSKILQTLGAEYAIKYGDLNNHYAKEKLGKTIKIVNEILVKRKIDNSTAESIFQNGFTFEDWFIRNAFSDGFNIKPLTRIERS